MLGLHLSAKEQILRKSTAEPGTQCLNSEHMEISSTPSLYQSPGLGESWFQRPCSVFPATALETFSWEEEKWPQASKWWWWWWGVITWKRPEGQGKGSMGRNIMRGGFLNPPRFGSKQLEKILVDRSEDQNSLITTHELRGKSYLTGKGILNMKGIPGVDCLLRHFHIHPTHCTRCRKKPVTRTESDQAISAILLTQTSLF